MKKVDFSKVREQMKINIQPDDYTWHGMGCNGYNLIHNVSPRISRWLVDEYMKSQTYSVEEIETLAQKISKIADIIDEEI